MLIPLSIQLLTIVVILYLNSKSIAFPLPFLIMVLFIIINALQSGLKGGINSSLLTVFFTIYSSTINFGPESLIGGALQIFFGSLIFIVIGVMLGSLRDQFLLNYKALLEHEKGLEKEVSISRQSLETANIKLQNEINSRKLREEELRSVNKYQSLIVDLEDRAFRGMDLIEFMDFVVEKTQNTFDTDYCKILKLLPGNKELLLVSGVGWIGDIVGTATVTTGTESQAGYTLINDHAIVVTDFSNEHRFSSPPILTSHDVRSGMSCIIRVDGEPYGVLGLHCKNPRIYSQIEINTIQVIANFLGVVILKHQNEELLIKSEKEYRILMDDAVDGIFISDQKGRYLEVNKAGLALLGYSREEMLELKAVDIMDSEELRNEPVKFSELIDGKDVTTQRTLIKKDGSKIIAELKAKMLSDGRFQAIVRDLTTRFEEEKKRIQLQDQLHKSQRMETIGQLAGGIAHDFNNYLTTILGFSKLLEDNLDPNSELMEYANAISNASLQSSTLIKQLLIFSRKQQIIPQIININDNIKTLMKMIPHILGEASKINLQLDNELGNIKIDSSQFDQILLNLALNAKDAMMPNGGLITIKTSNMFHNGYQIEGFSKGTKYAKLEFLDNGFGMSEETRTKAFEPFFTTKKVGTGLGLATIKRIVEDNLGVIKLTSEMGIGTTFEIYFPIVEDEISPKNVVSESSLNNLDSNLEILVLEDNEEILKLIQVALKHDKITIHTANTKERAMKTFNELKKCDIIISDIILPDGTGIETIKQIRNQYPELQVILMTGYADLPIKQQIDFDHQMLEKPFNVNELKEVLARLI